MNNNNNHHGNKFFEGFMWGLIIGGAIVFVLGTKKGKKLFKALTEGGIESLSDIIEEADLGEDYEEIDDDEEVEEKVSNGNGIEKSDKIIKEVKPSVRKRFFRKRSS